jgi:hypothetical protein
MRYLYLGYVEVVIAIAIKINVWVLCNKYTYIRVLFKTLSWLKLAFSARLKGTEDC